MALNFEGDGSKENPYKIYTEIDLRKLAKFVNDGESCKGKYFNLRNKIVISDVPWIPIGLGEPENCVFNGNFDGMGYEIAGIKIGRKVKPDESMKALGLFGVISGTDTPTVIKNLSVRVDIYSKNKFVYMGGMVGIAYNKSFIENCSALGIVAGGNGVSEQSGNFPVVGGLIGFNAYDSTILRSCSEVQAMGGDYAVIGGLVGWNLGSKIRNSFAIGKLIGHNYSVLGGLVGYNSHEQAIVSNSFADTKVIAGDFASLGGLVGWNTEGSVKNSHGVGDVMGNNEAIIAGLVGWNKDGRIVGCSWNKDAVHMANGDFVEESAKRGVLCFDDGFSDTSKAIGGKEIKKIVTGRMQK